MGNEVAHNPFRLRFIQSSTGNEDMDMDVPGKASAEGVHDQHKTWQIILFFVVYVGIPISQRLIDNAVEAIEVFPSANAEVV